MKTIFELATPRKEVLQGDLREEMFAARLRDVMEKTADDVYKLPDRFFENTFPTDGLKTLLNEVLGRLTGQSPANNPIIRLETSFGGGKTHNLIALYHAVSGEVDPKTNQPRPLRPEVALDLARIEVIRLRKEGLLAGRDVQFDPVTDWYLNELGKDLLARIVTR